MIHSPLDMTTLTLFCFSHLARGPRCQMPGLKYHKSQILAGFVRPVVTVEDRTELLREDVEDRG